MVILANTLMVLLAVALIGMPFIKRNKYQMNFAGETGEQASRKELLFSALGEIEFDYRMNKLDSEDYEELKAGYQREALAVLDQEEEVMEEEMEKKLAQKQAGSENNLVMDDENE